MARNVMADEQLCALREAVARIEGRNFHRLAAAEEFPAPGQFREEHGRETRCGGAVSAAAPVRPQPAGETAPFGGTASAATAANVLPSGVEAFDRAAGGGLALDALTEIRGLGEAEGGAATAFALACAGRMRRFSGRGEPVLFIGDPVCSGEAGLPYAAGLRDFGLPPGAFYHARPKRIEDALRLAGSALRFRAFAAVILEVRGNPVRFSFTESRCLSLRAQAAGKPLIVLRLSGEEEASGALLRLGLAAAPSLPRLLPDGSVLSGSLAAPAFRLVVEKSRFSARRDIRLAWSSHDLCFLPAALPDSAAAHPGAGLSVSGDRPDRPPPLGSVLAFGRAS